MDDPKLSAADRLNFAVAAESLKGKKRKRDKSPRRDGSRRRRKKRRSRGRDGSTSTDSSPSDKGLFRVGSSLSGGSRSRIQKIADDQPGELYSQAVGDINGFLGARGAASRGAKSSESWMTYLQAVVFAQHPPSSLPPEKVRELEAKAKALDRLGSGALKGTADQLTQEFKALELELAGRKDIAEELQLVGLEDKMLVSKAELASAQRSRAWKHVHQLLRQPEPGRRPPISQRRRVRTPAACSAPRSTRSSWPSRGSSRRGDRPGSRSARPTDKAPRRTRRRPRATTAAAGGPRPLLCVGEPSSARLRRCAPTVRRDQWKRPGGPVQGKRRPPTARRDKTRPRAAVRPARPGAREPPVLQPRRALPRAQARARREAAGRKVARAARAARAAKGSS